MSYESMTMALVGRILVGFGSAEVVNRQLISACVSFRYMTEASALFVAAGASGMSIGPLVAAILDILSGRDTDVDLWLPFLPSGGIIYNHVTSPGFLMAGLWFLQMVVLALLFHEPLRVNAKKNNNTRTAYSSLPKKLSQNPKSEERHIDYGSIEDRWYKPNVSLLNVGKELVDIGRLIFGNLALPVTMLLFGLIELVDEGMLNERRCKQMFKSLTFLLGLSCSPHFILRHGLPALFQLAWIESWFLNCITGRFGDSCTLFCRTRFPTFPRTTNHEGMCVCVVVCVVKVRFQYFVPTGFHSVYRLESGGHLELRRACL